MKKHHHKHKHEPWMTAFIWAFVFPMSLGFSVAIVTTAAGVLCWWLDKNGY